MSFIPPLVMVLLTLVNPGIGHECPKEQLHCPDQEHCIPHSWLCDGVNDCIYPFDEVNCTSTTTAPPKSRLKEGNVHHSNVHHSKPETKYTYFVIPGVGHFVFWYLCCKFCCRKRNEVQVTTVVQQQAPTNGNMTQQPQQQPIGPQQPPPPYEYASSAELPPPYGQQLGQTNYPNSSPVTEPVMMAEMKKTPEAPSPIPDNPNNRLDQPMEDTRVSIPDDESLITKF